MKAGAEALGFPAYQSLVIGIVLAVCVVVHAIPAPRCWAPWASPPTSAGL